MASFEAKIKRAMEGEKPDVIGVVTLAVGRDGNTLISHAAGNTNLAPSVSTDIDKNSVFILASSTKLITAIATLRLVEQGQAELDGPSIIEQHLPELWQQEIITSSPGQPLTFKERTKPITVRHLLTHTSGPAYDFLVPQLLAWRKERGEGPQHFTGSLPDAIAMPGLFQPGEGWVYGGGSDWVGLLISRISGMTLGEFMRKEIFDVLGCDFRIGFSRREIEKAGGAIVQVATRGPNGDLTEHPVPEQKSERGGGGLFASSSNVAKILADLIAPEPRVLSSKTLDVLFDPQFTDGSTALAALRQQAPVFTSMTGPLTASLSDEAINYALGGLLITQDSEELGKCKGTLTWGGAFGTLWFANRELGVAGFYGGSMFPPEQGVSSGLMGDFVKLVWEGVASRSE